MATTMTVDGQSKVPQGDLDYFTSRTDRIFFYKYSQVTAAAPTDDITILTVPTGRIFYMTAFYAGRNTDSAYASQATDASGGVSSGPVKMAFVIASAKYPAVYKTFTEPIVWTKGITIPAANQPADTMYFEIMGYLV